MLFCRRLTVDNSYNAYVLPTVDRSTVDISDDDNVMSTVDRSTVDNSYNAYDVDG